MPVLNGYLALGNIDPSTLAFTELAGASAYARQAIALLPQGFGGIVRNSAEIQFPSPVTATWPDFRAYAVFDALSAGVQLMAWDIGSRRSIRPTKRHTIATGAIQLTFPTVLSNHGTEVIMAGPYVASPDRIFASLATATMTQAAYDALAVKDPNTLYVIVG